MSNAVTTCSLPAPSSDGEPRKVPRAADQDPLGPCSMVEETVGRSAGQETHISFLDREIMTALECVQRNFPWFSVIAHIERVSQIVASTAWRNRYDRKKDSGGACKDLAMDRVHITDDRIDGVREATDAEIVRTAM